MSDSERIIALIIDLKESLEKEISGFRNSLERDLSEGFRDVRNRLDAIQARLDMQGGKIRAGTLWTVRLDEWSDKVDHLIAERDREISDLKLSQAELRKRVEKLEKNGH